MFLLEYLIDSRFRHGKLKENANKTDHDQRARSAENGKISICRRYKCRKLQRLKNDRDPQEEQHTGVKQTPTVS